jgi:hypothetical protein
MHDLPLSVGVMLDICRSSAEIGMTGEHLDIPQGAARFANSPGRSGDKGSTTGMAGAANHSQVRV